MSRRWIGPVLAGLLVLATAGCGGADASTTCSDFLNMSEQTQETAVETLAAKTHGDAFKGPMGLANVVYGCQETPHKTLGALMGVS
ncbi:hypothetical protein [Actinomycetospora chiangmaiensis]|uniref:hypothetical protein n=1 Tax=Actinomycetospora chiangmaiensis TaxID=402650 RepID=UPI000376D503|nr:hypothetical protein [Actinomycetospora chiangmaiensis]